MPDTVMHPDAGSLADLEDHAAFVHRHIGPDREEQAQMLAPRVRRAATASSAPSSGRATTAPSRPA